MIALSCPACRHEFEVDGSLAGERVLCERCGFKLAVPAGGFRLRPIPEDEQEESGGVSIEPYELAADEPPPAVLDQIGCVGPDAGEASVGPESIPEEFLADRAPLALDDVAETDQQAGPIELASDENRSERP